jgi:hypothetical protein
MRARERRDVFIGFPPLPGPLPTPASWGEGIHRAVSRIPQSPQTHQTTNTEYRIPSYRPPAPPKAGQKAGRKFPKRNFANCAPELEENIRHPTSNIEHPMISHSVLIGGWALDVGCFPGFMAVFRLAQTHGRDARATRGLFPPYKKKETGLGQSGLFLNHSTNYGADLSR